MRPEKLYLTDILEAARAIATFCAEVRFDQFEGNDMLRSADHPDDTVASSHRRYSAPGNTNQGIAQAILNVSF